jgi:hypothetical protein
MPSSRKSQASIQDPPADRSAVVANHQRPDFQPSGILDARRPHRTRPDAHYAAEAVLVVSRRSRIIMQAGPPIVSHGVCGPDADDMMNRWAAKLPLSVGISALKADQPD